MNKGELVRSPAHTASRLHQPGETGVNMAGNTSLLDAWMQAADSLSFSDIAGQFFVVGTGLAMTGDRIINNHLYRRKVRHNFWNTVRSESEQAGVPLERPRLITLDEDSTIVGYRRPQDKKSLTDLADAAAVTMYDHPDAQVRDHSTPKMHRGTVLVPTGEHSAAVLFHDIDYLTGLRFVDVFVHSHDQSVPTDTFVSYMMPTRYPRIQPVWVEAAAVAMRERQTPRTVRSLTTRRIGELQKNILDLLPKVS